MFSSDRHKATHYTIQVMITRYFTQYFRVFLERFELAALQPTKDCKLL